MTDHELLLVISRQLETTNSRYDKVDERLDKMD